MSGAGARAALATIARILALATAAGASAMAWAQPVAGEDCAREPGAVERSAGGYYEGRFDGSRRLAANLAYPDDRPGLTTEDGWPPSFAGASWSPGPGFDGRSLALEPSADPPTVPASDGGFAFDAVERRRDRGDELVARIDGRFAADRRRASGRWIDARDGGSTSTFTLDRVAEYHGLHLVEPLSDPDADPADPPRGPYIFDATWPVLPDAQAAERVREAATRCVGHSGGVTSESHEAAVRWHGADAATIFIQDFSAPILAAHPQTNTRTLDFARTGDGALAPAGLVTAIADTPRCKAWLQRRVVSLLRQQKAGSPERARLAAGDVSLLPGGLLFTFDAYAVSDHADGRFEAFVPRRELGACLRRLPTAR